MKAVHCPGITQSDTGKMKHNTADYALAGTISYQVVEYDDQ